MQLNKRYLIHGFLPGFFSACCFAGMATCIKIVSSELPTPQLVFFRSVFGLMIILPFILLKGTSFIKTSVLYIHIFRGFISILAMSCFFYVITHIGLAESTLLNATSPLFIGLISVLLLKEAPSIKEIFVLIIGFLGVTLILKPGTNLFALAALIGLCSGFFIATAKILIRHMASTEPVMRTVFYFSVTTSIYSSILMIWFWQTPKLTDIFIMFIATLCATGGQTLLTYSFTHNKPSTVAPFTYVTVIFATLIGWLGWGELPDISSAIGAVLISIACISLLFNGKFFMSWTSKNFKA